MNDVATTQQPRADLAELGGSKLIQYGEMVAKHVEDIGNSFAEMAAQMKRDCDLLAKDVRTMCQLQAQRSKEVAERGRVAAIGIRDLHDAFRLPLKEIKEEPCASSESQQSASSLPSPSPQ